MYRRNKDGDVVEAALKVHKKTGLHYREETSDRSMILDCSKNYVAVEIQPGSVILDLGANIGAFSVLSARKGGVVHAYEACSINYEMVKYNIDNSKETVYYHHNAVVPDDYEEEYITFYAKKSKNTACSGTVVGNKNKSWIPAEKVKAIKFTDLVNSIQPSIVKMDIEGGEYGIIDRPIPSCVKILACELHGLNKKDKVRMYETLDLLEKDWNFLVKEPEIVFGKEQLYNLVMERK